jgi:hypothetical protein
MRDTQAGRHKNQCAFIRTFRGNPRMRGTDAETPSGRRRYVKGRSAERLAFEGEELRRPSYRRPELWAAVQSAHRVSRPETKSLARMNSRPSSRLFKASSSATSDPGSFDAAQTVTQHRTPSPEGFDPGEQRAGRNHARTLRGPTNLFRQTLLTRCGRSGSHLPLRGAQSYDDQLFLV